MRLDKARGSEKRSELITITKMLLYVTTQTVGKNVKTETEMNTIGDHFLLPNKPGP